MFLPLPVQLLKPSWGFICQGLVGSNLIIEVDVLVNAFSEIRQRGIIPAISFFLLERGKERLRHRIVHRPTGIGKGLCHAVLHEQLLERLGCILPAPVAVERQSRRPAPVLKCRFECGSDQLCALLLGHSITHHPAGEQVYDDTEKYGLVLDLKICNVAYPYLVYARGFKFSLEQILFFVRLSFSEVLLRVLAYALQAQLMHDRPDTLFADMYTAFGQYSADPFCSIPLLAVLKDLPDLQHECLLCLKVRRPIRPAKNMVIKCAPGDIQRPAQLMDAVLFKLLMQLCQYL